MTRTENVAPEILTEVQQLQSKSTQMINALGELHMRSRDIAIQQKQIESDFDAASARYEQLIIDLRTKYPNGEIDMTTGIVSFEH